MKKTTLIPAFNANKPLPPYSQFSPHNPESKCIDLLKTTTHIHQFRQILAFFFTTGLKNSNFLATKLVDFCNFGHDMCLAYLIFSQIPYPSSFLWTAMIRGFTQNGSHHQSILFFGEMHRSGTNPSHLTYPFVLKACANSIAVLEGNQIHAQIVKSGFLLDIYVQTAVLGMYSKFGFIDDAQLLYDEMPQRDLTSHTSIISGYFGVGDLISARSLFDKIKEAERDVVLWSAMVSGYAQNGAPEEALELFEKMQYLGVKPNSVTMVNVVSACAQLGDFHRGKWVHEFIGKSGIEMNTILCTSLLDMYLKGEFIAEARDLFNQMPQKDIVSWNSLINGYAKNGYATEALEVFEKMQDLCIEPNWVTILTVLSSCAQLGALEKGREINYLVEKMGIGSNFSVGTALLDMYAKCGSLPDAHHVFNRIHPKDVVTWSAMINGYAMNGRFMEAFSVFGRMFKEGVKPNRVTFVGLLTACSHGGWVHEGFEYFNSMVRDHCISPRMEHYACIVDLLGRAGRVKEAKRFIDKMPIEPGPSVWGSLLGACRTHKNIDIGEHAARHLIELEPTNDYNYVLLSNIYADVGRWEDVENMRAKVKYRDTQNAPGCSWIEVGAKIHEFLVGDRTHPEHSQIYATLGDLSEQLRLEVSFTIE